LCYISNTRKVVVPYAIVYITAVSQDEARKIGSALVEEKLVACVNIFPVQSVYRWQGKVEEAAEFALMAKTRQGLVDKVIERVKRLHSYQVPDIVSWRIENGFPEYLAWIRESTEEG
jgi:periplasmic divalent cation tolerance protein